MNDYNLLLRCPLCGEELRLSYAIASNKTEENKQKRHSYCRCGVWFPLMDASEKALSAAQQRWQEPETPESQNAPGTITSKKE